MLGQRKGRSNKQLLLRRAINKVKRSNPYLNPCNISERSALYDVFESRSASRGRITRLPAMDRDLLLRHNMQRSLSNNSWISGGASSRKTTRVAPIRPDKRLQKLLKHTPFRIEEQRREAGNAAHTKDASHSMRKLRANDNRSGHSLKPSERSRASSSGYPSSWNLAVTKEVSHHDEHVDENSLNEVINCEVLNRTPYDRQLNGPQVPLRPKVDNAIQCSLRRKTKQEVGKKEMPNAVRVATTHTCAETDRKQAPSKPHKLNKLKSKQIPESLFNGTPPGLLLPSIVQMDKILGDTKAFQRPNKKNVRHDNNAKNLHRRQLRPRSYSGKSETNLDGSAQCSNFDVQNPENSNKSGKSKKYKSNNYGGYTPSELSVNADACICELIGCSSEKYNKIEGISQPPSLRNLPSSSSADSSESNVESESGHRAKKARKSSTDSSESNAESESGHRAKKARKSSTDSSDVESESDHRAKKAKQSPSRTEENWRMKLPTEDEIRSYQACANSDFCSKSCSNSKKKLSKTKEDIDNSQNLKGSPYKNVGKAKVSADKRNAKEEIDCSQNPGGSTKKNVGFHRAQSNSSLKSNQSIPQLQSNHDSFKDLNAKTQTKSKRESSSISKGSSRKPQANSSKQSIDGAEDACSCKCPVCLKARGQTKDDRKLKTSSSYTKKQEGSTKTIENAGDNLKPKRKTKTKSETQPAKEQFQTEQTGQRVPKNASRNEVNRNTAMSSATKHKRASNADLTSTNPSICKCHCPSCRRTSNADNLEPRKQPVANSTNPSICKCHCPSCRRAKVQEQDNSGQTSSSKRREIKKTECTCKCPRCIKARTRTRETAITRELSEIKDSGSAMKINDLSVAKSNSNMSVLSLKREKVSIDNNKKQKVRRHETCEYNCKPCRLSLQPIQSVSSIDDQSSLSSNNSEQDISRSSSKTPIVNSENKEVQCNCKCPHCGIEITEIDSKNQKYNSKRVEKNHRMERTPLQTIVINGEYAQQPSSVKTSSRRNSRNIRIERAESATSLREEPAAVTKSEAEIEEENYLKEDEATKDKPDRHYIKSPAADIACEFSNEECHNICGMCKITSAKTKQGEAPVNLVIDDKCNVNQIIEILHDTVAGLERQKKLLSEASEKSKNLTAQTTNQTEHENSQNNTFPNTNSNQFSVAQHPTQCCGCCQCGLPFLKEGIAGKDAEESNNNNCFKFSDKNKTGVRKSSGCTFPYPKLSRSAIKQRTLQNINPTKSFVDVFNMAMSMKEYRNCCGENIYSCQFNNSKAFSRKCPLDEKYLRSRDHNEFLVNKRVKYLENDKNNSYERNILEGYELKKKMEIARTFKYAGVHEESPVQKAQFRKRSYSTEQKDLNKKEHRKQIETECLCKGHSKYSRESSECDLAFRRTRPKKPKVTYSMRDSSEAESKYSSEVLIERHHKKNKLKIPSNISFSKHSKTDSFLLCGGEQYRPPKETKSRHFFRIFPCINKRARHIKPSSKLTESMRSLTKGFFSFRKTKDEQKYELPIINSKVSIISYKDRDKADEKPLKTRSSLFEYARPKVERKRIKATPTRNSNHLNFKKSRSSLYVAARKKNRQPINREVRRTKSISFKSESNLSLYKRQKVEARKRNRLIPKLNYSKLNTPRLKSASFYCKKPESKYKEKIDFKEQISKSNTKLKVSESKSLSSFCKKKKTSLSEELNDSRLKTFTTESTTSFCKKSKGEKANKKHSLERQSIRSILKTSNSYYCIKPMAEVKPKRNSFEKISNHSSHISLSHRSKNEKEQEISAQLSSHKKSTSLFSCLSRTKKEKKDRLKNTEQKSSEDKSKTIFSGFFCRKKSSKKDKFAESSQTVQKEINLESETSKISSSEHRRHQQKPLKVAKRDNDVKVLYDSSYKFNSYANNNTDTDCTCDSITKNKRSKKLKTLKSASGNHFFSMLTPGNEL